MARTTSIDKMGQRHLIDSLIALQQHDDVAELDPRSIWCQGYKSTIADPDATIQAKSESANASLFQMKSAARVLETLTKSVKEAIELVSTESSAFIHAAHFSSIPDDVLARIFELFFCEHNYIIFGSRAEKPLKTLVSVCKRFRRIVLHLPGLWEDVASIDEKDWILTSKQLCPNPVVSLSLFRGEESPRLEQGAGGFLQLLHQPAHWKGFYLSCTENNFPLSVDILSTRFSGEFKALEWLSIRMALDGEDWDGGMNINDTTWWNVVHNSTLLSKWRFPSLKDLHIKHFIPSPTGIYWPNLQTCSITLSCCEPPDWDLRALKEFLRAVHLVESLSFMFSAVFSPPTYKSTDSDPVKFPRLNNLVITVDVKAQPLFLTNVMDAIDAETLSTMKISLHEALEADRMTEWLHAIFTTSAGGRRVLTSVKTFDLRLIFRTYSERLAWPNVKDNIFPAIPHVQNVFLDLPDFYFPSIHMILKSCNDVRYMRLKNCERCEDVKVITGEEELRGLKKIERVELIGFHVLPHIYSREGTDGIDSRI